MWENGPVEQVLGAALHWEVAAVLLEAQLRTFVIWESANRVTSSAGRKGDEGGEECKHHEHVSFLLK